MKTTISNKATFHPQNLLVLVSLFTVLLMMLIAQKSYGDDFKCPHFMSGTYPDKFQTPGNNSSIWTLDLEGSDFVEIAQGVTWVHRSVNQSVGTPKLICEGYVNGSNQPIKAYYPMYFSHIGLAALMLWVIFLLVILNNVNVHESDD